MMERRYDKDEVRRIFELATRQTAAQHSAWREGGGLTLAEIQDIGREVGVEPLQVARAAAALDARPLRKQLGQPIEVGRVVHLPRDLTDREWDQLVAELRSTFRAQGIVTIHGGIREWRNGNLHAALEPTEGGYRLRLGTFKGDAAGVTALGVIGVIAGVTTFSALWLAGEAADAMILSSVLTAGGIGAFLTNTFRLPRWAKERQRQMEHIAAKVAAMVNTRDKGEFDG